MSAERVVRVRIEGKVQNVWYRAWTTEEATRRGLCGWVRNRADGTVEALFIGSSDAVTGMATACRVGPPDARVTNVIEYPAQDDGSKNFRQTATE
ncbi:MAG: acylphosphatase [Alphaproteobacteria bacterium]|nr:acylphosphatase [Alphaproteobacteria bacterium]